MYSHSETLDLKIKTWRCNLIPSHERQQGFANSEFTFEALCFTEPFKDLEVLGDIEVITPAFLSQKLPTSWASIPPITEGHGRLSEIYNNQGEKHPGLWFTLFSNHSALEWICQALLVGFGNPKIHFGMRITIESVNQEEFSEARQIEDWNVVSWELDIYPYDEDS